MTAADHLDIRRLIAHLDDRNPDVRQAAAGAGDRQLRRLRRRLEQPEPLPTPPHLQPHRLDLKGPKLQVHLALLEL